MTLQKKNLNLGNHKGHTRTRSSATSSLIQKPKCTIKQDGSFQMSANQSENSGKLTSFSKNSVETYSKANSSLLSKSSTLSKEIKCLQQSIIKEDQVEDKLSDQVNHLQLEEDTHLSRTCASCSNVITNDGFLALGQLYHTCCFRCKFCKLILGEDFFVREEKPCCDRCYKEVKKECSGCRKKILDDHIVCNNSVYHPECMKCQTCGDQIRGKFLTYKDRPICERDLKAISQVCSVCDQIITDNVIVVDGSVFCELHYNELKPSDVCPKCKKVIDLENSLRVGDIKFHHDCLKCEICKKNMDGKPITLDNRNRVYCTEDYTRKFASMCVGCNKKIVPKKGQTVASRIRVQDKDFHLACFKCTNCSLILDTNKKGKECWPLGEELFCYRCYKTNINKN